MHGTEGNIFVNRKFATIYARRTLHEKKEFLQKHQIWLGRLSMLF